ncbi:hypothetical protein D9M73_285260 [compost metagenome]
MEYQGDLANGYFRQIVQKASVSGLELVKAQPASQYFHDAVVLQILFVDSAILSTVLDNWPMHKLGYMQRTRHPLLAESHTACANQKIAQPSM